MLSLRSSEYKLEERKATPPQSEANLGMPSISITNYQQTFIPCFNKIGDLEN